MSDGLFEELFDSEEKGREVVSLPVNDIRPNSFNRKITDESVDNLVAQLETDDWELIHPITVIEKPDLNSKYMIIAGERRWRAFVKGGKDVIDVNIKDIDNTKMMRLNLMENFSNEPEKLVEQAKRFKAYIEECKLPQSVVAREFNIPATRMSEMVNHIHMVDQIPEINALYESGISDTNMLADLVKVYRSSPEACRSIIAFGEANNVLSRRFVRGASKLDIYGDIEEQLRTWQLNNFNGDPLGLIVGEKEAPIVSDKQNTAVPEDSTQAQVSSEEEEGESTQMHDTERQVDIEDAISDKDIEDDIASTLDDIDSDDDAGSDEDEKDAVKPTKSQQDAVIEVGDIRMKKRPVGQAEILVKVNGENLFLDLGHVSLDEDKVILRNSAGDFLEVEADKLSIEYVA